MGVAGFRRHDRISDTRNKACATCALRHAVKKTQQKAIRLTHSVNFIRKHLPPALHNAAGTLIAAFVLSLGGLAALVPRIRTFLVTLAGREIVVPGWVAVIFALCAMIVLFQIVRWIAFRPKDVRLFRSLPRDERSIIRFLAQSDYGLTEGELSELVDVPTQRFFYFIDHLVHDLRLTERSEPATGGAFWSLSERGRRVAAANELFRRRPN
jgi:hypothetical protein